MTFIFIKGFTFTANQFGDGDHVGNDDVSDAVGGGLYIKLRDNLVLFGIWCVLVKVCGLSSDSNYWIYCNNFNVNRNQSK